MILLALCQKVTTLESGTWGISLRRPAAAHYYRRALLQDRPILVLDEATAFADPENEAALIKALAAAMRGRTVIMVAHRLSMVTQADVILLFSDGQLREMGNHTQLLAQGGLYQRLWQHYQQAQHWVPGGTQEEVVENERQ